MTPLNDGDLDTLERALTEAHRSRHEPVLRADWARHVMQDVRREAAGRRHPMEFPGVDRLVWRTAAAAAALALVLTGSVLFYTPGDATESSALWASEFDTAMAFIE
jgi:hypothetical protein